MRVVKSVFLSVWAEFDRLRVVLVATRNPLNIGAAARAMSNFGFRHLRVVSPYEPAFREARSAVGAVAAVEVGDDDVVFVELRPPGLPSFGGLRRWRSGGDSDVEAAALFQD